DVFELHVEARDRFAVPVHRPEIQKLLLDGPEAPALGPCGDDADEQRRPEGLEPVSTYGVVVDRVRTSVLRAVAVAAAGGRAGAEAHEDRVLRDRRGGKNVGADHGLDSRGFVQMTQIALAGRPRAAACTRISGGRG